MVAAPAGTVASASDWCRAGRATRPATSRMVEPSSVVNASASARLASSTRSDGSEAHLTLRSPRYRLRMARRRQIVLLAAAGCALLAVAVWAAVFHTHLGRAADQAAFTGF